MCTLWFFSPPPTASSVPSGDTATAVASYASLSVAVTRAAPSAVPPSVCTVLLVDTAITAPSSLAPRSDGRPSVAAAASYAIASSDVTRTVSSMAADSRWPPRTSRRRIWFLWPAPVITVDAPVATSQRTMWPVVSPVNSALLALSNATAVMFLLWPCSTRLGRAGFASSRYEMTPASDTLSISLATHRQPSCWCSVPGLSANSNLASSLPSATFHRRAVLSALAVSTCSLLRHDALYTPAVCASPAAIAPTSASRVPALPS
mmetsp:Transcript_20895/g.51093  ORF Transcript_20895/g.51093 Transcript_20895/m.51093 type:complete len:262 (-) Transcript_20895:742-1527(-)